MSTPQDRIREYVEEHGQTEVPFHNLLTTWQVEEPTGSERARITDELAAAGVETDPPLTDLAANDPVVLRVIQEQSEETAAAAPPWATPSTDNGSPDAGTTQVLPAAERTDERPAPAPPASSTEPASGGRGKTLAAVAVIAVLGLGAGVGGYFVGKGSGEDLDAARAAGAAQGQREGAARGAERGYDAGFKEGRSAGYKQTFDKAYTRAYKQEFKEAGLAVPTKVRVP